jgi:regulation of enolase protein 1 (concanavalin A-like superfamily)
MKKSHLIFLIIFVVFILSGCVTLPIKIPEPAAEKIISIPGFKKNQIYEQCKIFIAENFKSAKAVIEYDNKEQGILIGNGNVKYPCTGSFECSALHDWVITFGMRIDVKDEKIRVSFSRLTVFFPSSSAIYFPLYIPARSSGERSLTEEEYVNVKYKLLEIADRLATSVKASGKKESW